VIVGVKSLSEESAAALKKQQTALKEIEVRLERIEGNLVPNQAMLKSLDDPENIKGIGPSLGKELTGMGITSVGDFLTTDPAVIGEKTRVSQEAAENLQSMAQLMMVPGVDANDAEILVEAGIKSRKDLANQDLIQLSRKVNEISRIYVSQGKISKDKCPTIEEISYWIRTAK
jgi:predicted RecB family nuclease